MTIVKTMIKYIFEEKHKSKIEFLRKFSRDALLFSLIVPPTSGSVLLLQVPPVNVKSLVPYTPHTSGPHSFLPTVASHSSLLSFFDPANPSTLF